MKLLRLCVFACVMGLALSSAGCGGEPPTATVETKASALTSVNVWQGTKGLFNGYSYSCAGSTWNLRQYVTQSWSNLLHFGSTTMTTDAAQFSSSIDPNLNEAQVICPQTQMVAIGTPTYMYNGSAIACDFYAHPAHSGWQWSGQVTFAAGNLRYAQKGTFGYPNGYWDMQLTLPGPLAFNQIGTGYGLTCLGALGSDAEIYAF